MRKNRIAQVIPALRLKRDMHFFDYEIPSNMQEQAQVGQLVEIPFRKQFVKGVILNLTGEKSQNEFELKPISKIIDPLPFLAKWQLDLIRDLSEYYFVSMGVLLKMIIPDIPKRVKSSEEKFLKNLQFISAPKEKIDINDFYNLTKPVLLQYFDADTKIKIYLGTVEKVIKQNKQVAIICPQLINIKKIFQYLGDYKEQTSVFLNDLPMNKYFEEYNKIKSGQAKIIIGTRSAIFAPFNNLDLIIINEEDNENHKQEEPNPRYNAKAVASKIKDLLGAKLILTSTTPSLDSIYKTKNGDWEFFEINKATQLPQIKIIDKKEEFKKGNYSIFSEELIKDIENNLKKKEKIFLFLNRKGIATLAICQDCGQSLQCPACKLPLTYYANKKMTCGHCGFEEDLTLFCPECKSPNIKLSGAGTEKVEQEIKKLFPKAKITKIDIKTPQPEKDLSNYDIIIGTQYAFDFINWQTINLIGVISADTSLYIPDFKSTERTFDLLAKMILFLGKENKKIIIQTLAINNYIFKYLIKLDFQSFYGQELEERKAVNLPPFVKIIKLIYQSYKFNAGQKEANEIYKILELQAKNNEVFISSPNLIYSQQVRGRFRWQMIIKILKDNTNIDFLKKLPDDVIIDVKPLSLI
ncbi:primosomal protein N' [Candidatus Falkowbacteria bacterium]|nr:primosomal protein N' [Candidatus Falkowbacteria bacterium]